MWVRLLLCFSHVEHVIDKLFKSALYTIIFVRSNFFYPLMIIKFGFVSSDKECMKQLVSLINLTWKCLYANLSHDLQRCAYKASLTLI